MIDSLDCHDGHVLVKGHVGVAVLPALLALIDSGYAVDDQEFLTLLVLGLVRLVMFGGRWAVLTWAAVPFVLALLVALAVLTFVPEITLWLPNLLLPEPVRSIFTVQPVPETNSDLAVSTVPLPVSPALSR